MDARAEIRHQVAKRSRFPSLIERFEALRHTVGGRRDLVGIDGVEFPGELRSRQALRIPEDEGSTRDQPSRAAARGSALVGRSRRATRASKHPPSAAPVRWHAYSSMLTKGTAQPAFACPRPLEPARNLRTFAPVAVGTCGSVDRSRRAGTDKTGNRGRSGSRVHARTPRTNRHSCSSVRESFIMLEYVHFGSHDARACAYRCSPDTRRNGRSRRATSGSSYTP